MLTKTTVVVVQLIYSRSQYNIDDMISKDVNEDDLFESAVQALLVKSVRLVLMTTRRPYLTGPQCGIGRGHHPEVLKRSP